MAIKTVVDYRRRDLRNNTLENPFWITSAVFCCVECEDKYGVLFSFPVPGQIVIVQEVMLELLVAITAASTIDIGYSTLATDDVTTDGVATTVDDDDYIKSADVTIATPGYYSAATSDWLTLKAAGIPSAAPYRITGADTTVPCVTVTTANVGTILAGQARLHMLITVIPGSTY